MSVTHLIVLIAIVGGVIIAARAFLRASRRAAEKPVIRDVPAAARTLGRFLIAYLLAQGIGLFAAFGSLAAYGSLPPTEGLGMADTRPELAGVVAFGGLASIVQIVTFLATGYFFLRWTWRIMANARTLDPAPRIEPGWALLWHFIPIASFWKPFDALRQAYEAASPRPAAETSVPFIARVWWGLWVVTLIMDNASGRAWMSAKTVADANAAASIEALSCLFSLPMTYLAMRVVRRWTETQRTALARV